MKVFINYQHLSYGETLDYEMAQNPLYPSWSTEPQFLYTLILYDLSSFYLHFLEMNIPGNYLSQGKVIIPYLPPLPQVGTRKYFLEVYKQEEPLNLTIPPLREGFDLFHFIKRLDLKLVDSISFLVRALT